MKELVNQGLELKDILQSLLNKEGISVNELSKRIDLPQPTLHRIVKGIYKQPHLKTLKLIADYFEVTINQLKGVEFLENLNIRKLQSLPLLNMDEVLTRSNSLNIKNFLLADIPMSKDSFAVVMTDKSMEPLIPKGSTLLIDPLVEPLHNGVVLIKFNINSNLFVRQFITDGKNNFLKALDINLSAFEMVQLNEEDSILGVVVQVRYNCN